MANLNIEILHLSKEHNDQSENNPSVEITVYEMLDGLGYYKSVLFIALKKERSFTTC